MSIRGVMVKSMTRPVVLLQEHKQLAECPPVGRATSGDRGFAAQLQRPSGSAARFSLVLVPSHAAAIKMPPGELLPKMFTATDSVYPVNCARARRPSPSVTAPIV